MCCFVLWCRVLWTLIQFVTMGCLCDLTHNIFPLFSTVAMAGNIWIAALMKRKGDELFPTETQTACQFYSTEIHLQMKRNVLRETSIKEREQCFPSEIGSLVMFFQQKSICQEKSNVTRKAISFFWWTTLSDFSSVPSMDCEVFKSRIMNCGNTITKLSLIVKSNDCILKNIAG